MKQVEPRFKGEPVRRGGRKSLPPYSPRWLSERELRAKLVEVVRRRDRDCQARELVPSIRCGGPLDCHEVIPRSAWRKGYLVLSNVKLVCRCHHDWVGDNPAAAHRLGLHGFSMAVSARSVWPLCRQLDEWFNSSRGGVPAASGPADTSAEGASTPADGSGVAPALRRHSRGLSMFKEPR